ncbi:protein WVD2-like 4 [Cryptomeria japonica]|uniref:protein WVD2-like 4 n=1 Tax=Cryptomeria japonica TaxID=3369 RepID=UPI0025ABB24E|nr:protein WVD2-like 4 [Cryptomeria japonica]XP_057871273.1 protein WVD2-like 4 [Cryptomeria japonica]XP_057871274.1 protein WVD2-like 4 [Cryptomeria japonica]XP_057871275.1 protein WVD2-like 4 [Cryptomeria japonica]XP_059069843.1 protein WVD2-like 4 [Cryptomeria japonica]
MEELGSSSVVAKSMKDGGYAGNYEKENIDHDANTITGNSKTDGSEEILVPVIDVQERGKEATDIRVTQFGITDDVESHSEVTKQSNITIEEQEQSDINSEWKNTHGTKEIGLSSKQCSIQSKLQKAGTSVPGKGVSSLSQIQKSKHPQNVGRTVKGGVKDVVDTSCKQKKSTQEKSPIEVHGLSAPVLCTVNDGGSQSNHTVPQPFSLSTGKRASTGGTSRQAHTNSISLSATKDAQLAAKYTLTSSTKKPSHSVNSKLNRHVLKDIQQKQSNAEVEETCSVASSVNSVKAYKSKLVSSASSHGFVSRCDERAEKRKEFFSKLDEKLHAREEEINQLQAKTKEEKEAAIKELRRSLTFKATPMPSFYHEASLPKVELKKIPPTRAKSPKLGRRKSSSGVESDGNPVKLCTAASVFEQSNINKSLQKVQNSANLDKSSDKGRVTGQKSMHKSVTKLPSEKPIKIKSKARPHIAESDILNMPDVESASGSTENGKFGVISESHTSSVSSNHDHRLEAKQSETVLELKEFDFSSTQNDIAGEVIDDNILRESDSLIDNVEDLDPGLMALDEKLHACFVAN